MTSEIVQDMDKVHRLPMLRPLGKSEQLSAVSHELEFFKNVGMSAHYTLSKSAASLDLRQVVYAAVTEVIRRNDILSAIPVDEASPDAYFARLPSIDLTRCVFFKSRTSSIEQDEQDPELDAKLQKEHNTDFKSDYGALPFWRLVVLQDIDSQPSFTASFIFHHSLGDGATGMIFHQSFHQALDKALTLPSPLEQSSSMVQIPASTTLLPPLEELHPLPLNPNPPNHQTDGLQEWTGNPIRLPLLSHYKTLYFSPTSSAAFAEKCKENGVSVTACLTAVMASAIFPALPCTFNALTGIIPINLRPWINNLPAGANSAAQAMGSFIDAIKVQIRRSHYEIHGQGKDRGWTGRLPAAKHTAEEIKRYLTGNPSPSGEPYTSVAAFKDIQDIPAVFNDMVGGHRDAAFEISNLGRFSCATAVSDSGEQSASSGNQWSIGRMTFSRSAVGFGAALTTSVVSGADGGLTMGFSWQEGVVEDSFVELVIKKFREHFESLLVS